MYLPYYLAGMLAVGLYAICIWKMEIKWHKLNVHLWLNYTVPFGISLILSEIILRKSVKIIYAEKRPKIARQFYIIFGAMLLTPAVMTTQNYIAELLFTPKRVKNVSEIVPSSEYLYYVIDSFNVSKKDLRYTYTYSSGSKSSFIDYTLHFALPITNDSTKVEDTVSNVWCGLWYETKISEYHTLSQREAELDSFISKVKTEIINTNFNKAVFFECLYQNERKSIYFPTINTYYKSDDKKAVILQPVYENLDEHRKDQLHYMIAAYAVFAIVFLFMSTVLLIDEDELAKYN